MQNVGHLKILLVEILNLINFDLVRKNCDSSDEGRGFSSQ